MSRKTTNKCVVSRVLQRMQKSRNGLRSSIMFLYHRYTLHSARMNVALRSVITIIKVSKVIRCRIVWLRSGNWLWRLSSISRWYKKYLKYRIGTWGILCLYKLAEWFQQCFCVLMYFVPANVSFVVAGSTFIVLITITAFA